MEGRATFTTKKSRTIRKVPERRTARGPRRKVSVVSMAPFSGLLPREGQPLPLGAGPSRRGRVQAGPMAELLTIGDCSRMTFLTVKALRHYHDLGLLEPARTDPHSGYRYY